VLTNYSILLETLENIQQGSDEYATKVTGFINLMKFSTYFGIKFSYLVFSAIEQLSITLQGKGTTIQETVMAINLAAFCCLNIKEYYRCHVQENHQEG